MRTEGSTLLSWKKSNHALKKYRDLGQGGGEGKEHLERRTWPALARMKGGGGADRGQDEQAKTPNLTRFSIENKLKKAAKEKTSVGLLPRTHK